MAFPLKYMKVSGRLGALIGDITGDEAPDMIAVSGQVEFRFNSEGGDYVIAAEAEGGPTIMTVSPVIAELNPDGDIEYNGLPYVALFTPDAHTNPSTGSYKVTFQNLRYGGTSINILPFNIPAVPDGEVNLARVARVPGTIARPVQVGPPGVSVSALRLTQDDDLIFTLSDGKDLPSINLEGISNISGLVDDAYDAAEDADAARVAAKASADLAGVRATESRGWSDQSKAAAADAATQVGIASGHATTANTRANAAAASVTAAADQVTAAQTQVGLATTQVGLAADQVTLAKGQVTAATTQAGNAAGSATAANTAKTAAETAKTAAETARTQAQTAKTDAETARTAAQGFSTTAGTKAGEAAASAVTAKTEADRAANYVGGVADNAISASKIQDGAVRENHIAPVARVAIAQNPEAFQYYHDHFAFGRWTGFPVYERKRAGVWTEETLDKRLFTHREAQSVAITTDGDNVEAARFTWSSNNFNYSGIMAIAFGVAYGGAARSLSATAEASPDNGATWKQVGTPITFSGSAVQYLLDLKFDMSAGYNQFRLTFARVTGTGGCLLTGIKALSIRKGNQGGGWENNFPFDWDENRKVMFKYLQLEGNGAAADRVVVSNDGAGNLTFRQLGTNSIADLAVTNAKIADVALSKVTGAQAALDAKQATIAAGTASQYFRGDKSWATLDKAAVGLSNVDNTADSAKPVSTAQQTAINTREAAITAGTAAQYFRGDKTWATHDKASVGLGNVDNTADASKPVSTAQQSAIDAVSNSAVKKTGDQDMAGSLAAGGSVVAKGGYTESSTVAGVHVGNSVTPRAMFANGTAAQNWQIDNQNGVFRWYLPGATHMQLSATALDMRSKPIQNVTNPTNAQDVATKKYVDDAKVSNASGQSLTLWKGTQAQYDAIASKDSNTIYVVTA